LPKDLINKNETQNNKVIGALKIPEGLFKSQTNTETSDSTNVIIL